jgi:phosphonate transport system substrate-binding protein
MAPLWQPLLDDMSAQVGVKMKPYFASNYTSLVEAMRFKQVQVGWFSAAPALEATRRADAEVLGRVIDAGGVDSYESVLIVKKGSGLTLDKVMACDHKLTFGMGDAKSTSGTLAPMAYLFTPESRRPQQVLQGRPAPPATRPIPSPWPTGSSTWPPTTRSASVLHP